MGLKCKDCQNESEFALEGKQIVDVQAVMVNGEIIDITTFNFDDWVEGSEVVVTCETCSSIWSVDSNLEVINSEL